MGGRQAVRPRTLDPVSKVRILPAQPLNRSVGLTRHYLVSLKSAVSRGTALLFSPVRRTWSACVNRRQILD